MSELLLLLQVLFCIEWFTCTKKCTD